MKIKSILRVIILAAVMLCAAAWQAPAQSGVYSLNVVGYYDVQMSPGWNLLANQLIPTNYNANFVLPPGTPVDGSLLYRFNPVTQSYYDAATYLTGVGWYPLSGHTNDSVLNLLLGEGFFIWTPQSWTATFVGDVPQGNLTNPLPANFSLKASMVPLAGALQTDLGFPAEDGDEVFRWVSPAFSPHFYDGLDNVWDPTEPSLSVGEGFFFDPAPGDVMNNWTVNFIVGDGLSPLTVPRTALVKAPFVGGAPVIVFSLQNGYAVLNIGSGKHYDVQFSTNLVSWTTVAVNQTATLWEEPRRPGPQGYYRLLVVP